MKATFKIFAYIAFASITSPWMPLLADSPAMTEAVLTSVNVREPLYTEDRITFQAMTGALTAPVGIGPDTPDLNYWQTNFRLGWMLNTPSGEGFFSGNVELMIELSSSYIFNGFGDVIVGPTALARYNFVQPDWKIVPYVQVGAGVVYTDAYKDHSQDAIGQAIEFTPQASVGFKYLVNDEWSIDVEGMYHHISNASMAPRNDGTNALGGFVGATYFFDKLWQ